MFALACFVVFLLPQQTPDGKNELRKFCLERIRTLCDSRDFERAEAVASLAQKLFPNDTKITVALQKIQSARNPLAGLELEQLDQFEVIQIQNGATFEVHLIPKKTSR